MIQNKCTKPSTIILTQSFLSDIESIVSIIADRLHEQRQLIEKIQESMEGR